jgi:hypothetical protein
MFRKTFNVVLRTSRQYAPEIAHSACFVACQRHFLSHLRLKSISFAPVSAHRIRHIILHSGHISGSESSPDCSRRWDPEHRIRYGKEPRIAQVEHAGGLLAVMAEFAAEWLRMRPQYARRERSEPQEETRAELIRRLQGHAEVAEGIAADQRKPPADAPASVT